MDKAASPTPLSPRARAAWRRAADELLIDAIFGDRARAVFPAHVDRIDAVRSKAPFAERPQRDVVAA